MMVSCTGKPYSEPAYTQLEWNEAVMCLVTHVTSQIYVFRNVRIMKNF